MGSPNVSGTGRGVVLLLCSLLPVAGDDSDAGFFRFREVPEAGVTRRVLGPETRGSVRVHPLIFDFEQR